VETFALSISELSCACRGGFNFFEATFYCSNKGIAQSLSISGEKTADSLLQHRKGRPSLSSKTNSIEKSINL